MYISFTILLTCMELGNKVWKMTWSLLLCKVMYIVFVQVMIIKLMGTSVQDTTRQPLPIATKLHPQQPLPHPLHQPKAVTSPKKLSAVQLNNQLSPIPIPNPPQVPILELARVTTPLAVVKLRPPNNRQLRLELKSEVLTNLLSTRAKVVTTVA